MEHEDRTPLTPVNVDYHSIIHHGNVAFQMIANFNAAV